MEGAASALPSEARAILLKTVFAKRPDAAMPVVLDGPGDDHPLACVQSSGTTGIPKTFLLSHNKVISSFQSREKSLHWTSEDRYAALVRLSFFAGCRLCFAALFAGATIIFNRARSIEEFVQFMQQKQVTATVLTPVHLRPLVEYAVGKPLLFPLLPTMRVATGSVTPQERDLARKHITPNIIVVYGSNELSWIAIATPADQDAHPDSRGPSRRGRRGASGGWRTPAIAIR